MTASTSTSSEPWLLPRRVLIAGLLALVVVGLLGTLYLVQRDQIARSGQLLEDMRQAQNELNRGFLRLIQADALDAGGEVQAGIALIDQAVTTYERHLSQLRGYDVASALAFQAGARAFRDRLAAWRLDPRTDTLIELRITFSHLERQAQALDSLAHRQRIDLQARGDRLFLVSLAGSILALGWLVASLMRAVLRERRALEALTEQYRLRETSEARFRQLFEEAPVALGLADPEGRLGIQNARFVELFGYTPDDIPDLEAWWRLAYPDPEYRRAVQERWQMNLAAPEPGPIDAGEYSIHCKNGDTRMVRIRTMRLPNGLLSAFIDQTEIRRAEQATREAMQAAQRSFEERGRALDMLAAIAEATQDAIFAKDLDGRYLLCNRAAGWLLGHAPQAVLGRDDQALLPAPEAAAIQMAEQAVLESGENRSDELRMLTPEGPRDFLVTRGPLHDADGTLTGVFAIARDISALKAAEQARATLQADRVAQQQRARQALLNQMQDTNAALASVRALNATLEARVAERTAALAAANKELETFTYSVSHDLKAPLRGIDGYSQLLLEDHREQLDEEGRLFLDRVREGVTRMSQLIEDLLAYSRMERRDLYGVPLALADAVARILDERRDELVARGVELDIRLGSETALADPDGLAMVLRNLVDNALKFSRDRQPPRLEIAATEGPESTILSIKDNGIGFDMQFRDRIFEIFQRLQRAEDYPGTGVGLAIVRKAMQRMGGRAWAESTPGQGATFYLELPR